MKKLLKTFIRFSLPVAAGLVAVSIHATPAHAYTNSRLMDDQVFDNVGTMNQAAIQSFLTNVSSTCLQNYTNINFHWDGSVWHYGDNSNGTGWNTAWGPATIPASTIIYQAAQMWGMNPQVLIATLQKEESLVTGTSCDSWRYNSAMGYGCPDSGGCNPKFAGFSKQVLWGGWQLAFGRHRSEGDLSWDGDGDVVYSGFMTAGTYRRCNTCSLVTYDGYATIDGQTIHLDNGTTASLYSYTPHLNQSFPGIFEGWFGSTWAFAYAAQYAGESGWASMLPGTSSAAFMEYQNVGFANWYDDTSYGSGPSGTLPVHLATTHPDNRISPLGSQWANQNRPALTFAAVYEADGTTLAANQHVATPNQIVKFTFNFVAPIGIAPGTYDEAFRPVLEGSAGGSFNDPGTWLRVIVQPAQYSAQYYSQSGWASTLPASTIASFFEYKNAGNVPWYDDSSYGSVPGALPVHLAATHPDNRVSPLGSQWANQNRPALNFAAVYEADGTTPAGNQHVVQPGQIAKFSFNFVVPMGVGAGNYDEYFRPVLEGTANGAFNDPGTWLRIVVQPYSLSATYVAESNWVAMPRNSSSSAFFEYKNSGNVPWYDDSSFGAVAGALPVHLATSHPDNRISALGSQWANQNRPALTFSAVYESDGSTLAGNQHVVQPGQIAKLSFNFVTTSSTPTGTYDETFRPVLEGTSNGAFNDPGTWLRVIVQ